MKKFGLKKMVAMVMIAAICAFVPLCISGCGPNDEQLIKESITKELDTLKAPTKESLQELMGSEIESNSAYQQISSYGVDYYDFMAHMLEHYDYKIGDINIDGDSATAEVTISNVDVYGISNQVTSNYMNSKSQYEFLSMYQSGGYAALYKDLFNQIEEAIDTATDIKDTEINITLTKYNDTWMVDASNGYSILKAAVGGSYSGSN